jgi:lipid-binding SYLF domain-containing protein
VIHRVGNVLLEYALNAYYRLSFQPTREENTMSRLVRLLIGLVVISIAVTSWGFEPDTHDKDQLATAQAIIDIKAADPGIEKFFEESAGYAVFPSVGKGGIGIGGAHGKGLVIVNDQVVGRSTLTQVTIGLQLGGQVYSEFVFFKDETALDDFQRGNFELGAQASAVAATTGASADADYNKGVAIFTHVTGGLMYEASVGGQKFTYDANP